MFLIQFYTACFVFIKTFIKQKYNVSEMVDVFAMIIYGKFSYPELALAVFNARNAVLVMNDCEAGVVDFTQPDGIAEDSKGQIFVVDCFLHCVHVFSPQLALQTTFGTLGFFGRAPGQFNQPTGIAVSKRDDRIYVADTDNHRVQVLSSCGLYISTLGLGFGVSPGYFVRPCALAIYEHPYHGELIIVCEWGGDRVQVFAANGDTFAIFGGVKKPYHVVVGADGCLYITEYVTRAIKIFALEPCNNQKKRKAPE